RRPSAETFVFTEAERVSASSRPGRAEAFAVRFAAKEACRKALGSAVSFQDVEILEDRAGRATLTVRGRADLHTHVSITRRAGVALAVVVVEESEPAAKPT